MLTISHNGRSWIGEVIKSASLSSGVNIWLLRRDVSGSLSNSYIVAAKNSSGETLEWSSFLYLKSAIVFYIDIIACYV